MKREYFFISVFFAVVALSFYLFYRLLAPFLLTICWAATFAIIFYPLYNKLEKKIKSSSLRALILTALVVLLIIGPIAYLAVALVQEAAGMVNYISAWIDEGKLDTILNFKNSPMYAVIESKLSPYFDLSHLDPKVILENALKTVSGIVVSQATVALTNAGRLAFQFSLMVFFMFFLFRDGQRLVDQIRSVIPMPRDKADITVDHLKTVIETTMYGGVVVALLQGFLGGMMFLILGLPSPVFWGAVMAFLAFIPILGPFLVYIPAGLILISTGHIAKGVILIAVGTAVVGQVDNFLRPLLMSGKTGMHTMLLFISIMGGVTLFGLLGIVLGPFIAAIFVSIFDIFRIKLAESDQPVPATASPPNEMSEETGGGNSE